MKIAIMANMADSFVKPLAIGLGTMCKQVGIEFTIFYDGLFFLDHNPPPPKIRFKGPKALLLSTYQSVFPPFKKRFDQIWKELESHDCMVVIETMPICYLRDRLTRIEEFRQRFPDKPVVLYDLIYLSTLGEWISFLKNGNDYHGFIQGKNHYGLERFDWYLIGSASTDFPMPEGPQPISLIGCHIDDGSLYPEQKEFHALVDFERPNHMKERAIQILALEDTNTPYTVLHGRYAQTEIRRIYRSSSIYFLAHLEAFGLPIAEVEACGGIVFSPYQNWALGHYQKPDLSKRGSAPLSSNFKVYNNNLETLKSMIEEAKSTFNSKKNLLVFQKEDDRFFHGNLDELKAFTDKFKSGEFTSSSHKSYEKLNNLIETGL